MKPCRFSRSIEMLRPALGIGNKVGVVIAALIAIGGSLPAADVLPPPPPAGHPRVLIQAADVAALRQSEQDTAVAEEWTEVRRRAGLPPDFRPGERYDRAMVQAAEANAFLAVVLDDRVAARKAIDLTFGYLDEALPLKRRSNDTRTIGRALFVLGEVYDWCFPALSAGEKSRLIAAVPQHAALMEIGFPPLAQSAIVGHAGEAQLFRDLLGIGIAMFDEEPSYHRVTAGRIYNHFVASRDFTYAGHFHNQGDAYGNYRFAWECWGTLLLTRMGAPSPFNLSDMAQVPYWLLYLRRPDGGFMQDGDEYQRNDNAPGAYWTHRANIWGLFAGLFRDAQFAQEWRRVAAKIEPANAALDEPILTLLLRPDRLTGSAVGAMPLSRYFPAPFGAIMARTGWNVGPDSRDAVAYMKIGTHQFGNHQHADSGQFQLYYRGSLALDTGIYQSSNTSYGAPHFLNYYQRSVAHNTLLIEEPSETSRFLRKTVSNDGGQRYLVGNEDAFTVKEFWSQERRFAHVRSHYIGPDPVAPLVSLIKGDLTPAYSSVKAAHVARTMVFLPLGGAGGPAAALVVLDHVESVKPEQRKVFLLHSQEEPTVAREVTTITRAAPQFGIRRLKPTAIESPGRDGVAARLTFDLSTWRGVKVRKAELVFHSHGVGQHGRFKVLADGIELANGTPGPQSPIESGLVNLGDWLRAGATAGGAAQVLTLVSEAAGEPPVLERGNSVRAPYIRAWIETEPYAGKLVQTTLLPAGADAVIEKIGGPGREFWSAGFNWPATSAISPLFVNEEEGAWRVEVSPRSAQKVARFLHVEQVMDVDTTPVDARLIDGAGFVGTALGGRLILASNDGRWLTGSPTFSVTPADIVEGQPALVVITDLPAGDCAVWRGDTIAGMAAITAPSHTFVLRLPAGDYRLEMRP